MALGPEKAIISKSNAQLPNPGGKVAEKLPWGCDCWDSTRVFFNAQLQGLDRWRKVRTAGHKNTVNTTGPRSRMSTLNRLVALNYTSALQTRYVFSAGTEKSYFW